MVEEWRYLPFEKLGPAVAPELIQFQDFQVSMSLFNVTFDKLLIVTRFYTTWITLIHYPVTA